MDACYEVESTAEILSPGLVVFRHLVVENIEQMIRIAGDPQRLRPHCKTHKMVEIAQIELQRGIARHKCATFAEAEMLAGAGAKDIFLAYNLVGPNIARAVAFRRKFPDVKFLVTADHPRPLEALDQAMRQADTTIEVLLDVDPGLHRTGLEPGPEAKAIYGRIVDSPSLIPGGFHLYDGHNHQTDLAERTAAVMAGWRRTADFRDELVADGWPVPRIVAGGTGSFPVFARIEDPALELSPGTCVLHDVGYGRKFPDLKFTPAALLLTRVISRPTADRLTTDLGYKACASDPPAGERLFFPDLPDAKAVLQNEEHLVLETPRADEFSPGDELWAIPRHVCPTSALHKQAWVVENGRVIGRWNIAARDRWLTI
jgi:D-serine deaminase-like pyridoxal phosphate-dependent protein